MPTHLGWSFCPRLEELHQLAGLAHTVTHTPTPCRALLALALSSGRGRAGPRALSGAVVNNLRGWHLLARLARRCRIGGFVRDEMQSFLFLERERVVSGAAAPAAIIRRYAGRKAGGSIESHVRAACASHFVWQWQIGLWAAAARVYPDKKNVFF